MGGNLYAKTTLTKTDLKQLFGNKVYQDETDIVTHLSALCLVECDELNSDSVKGELAFWLKVLSTPADEETRLQKLQFKQNVFKSYDLYVQPLLKPLGFPTPRRRKSQFIQNLPLNSTANEAQSAADTITDCNSTEMVSSQVIELTGEVVSIDDDGAVIDLYQEQVMDDNSHIPSGNLKGTNETPDVPVPTTAAPSPVVALAPTVAVPPAVDHGDSTSSVAIFPLKSHVSSVNQSSETQLDELKIFNCKFCAAKYLTSKELLSHKYTVHVNELPYKCPYDDCEYRTQHAWTLKHHAASRHVDTPQNACSQCDFVTKTRTQLHRHRLTVHEGKVRKCERCPYTCPWDRWSQLKQHTRMAHGVLIGASYSCRMCSTTCSSRAELQTHLTKEHIHVNRFTCPNCNFNSLSKELFVDHVCSEHPIVSKGTKPKHSKKSVVPNQFVPKFFCDKCGKSFLHERYAEIHITNYHSDAKVVATGATKPGTLVFCCNPCGKTFDSKLQADEHLESDHDSQVPVSVQFVEKADYKRTYLRCPHCEHKSENYAGLTSHIRHQHGKKTLKHCPHTGCKFITFHQGALAIHLVNSHGAPRKNPKRKPKTVTKLSGDEVTKPSDDDVTKPSGDGAVKNLENDAEANSK